MNTYVAFWKNKEITVQANSSYEAQQKAALQLKCRKTWEVTVMITEFQGKQVVHTPDF
jgi:stress-induced morphogen